jgi:hypothetical protein
VLTASNRLNELLRDYAPEDLARLNRKMLADAGLDPNLIQAFLAHPWYSPRHKTFIAEALVSMDGVSDRDRFLHMALNSQSEEDSLFFQRAAEMMSAYHERVTPLERIVDSACDLPAAYTQDQAMILFLTLDYASWTKPFAALVDEYVKPTAHSPPIARREIWVTGRLSPQALKQVSIRGVSPRERAMDDLETP